MALLQASMTDLGSIFQGQGPIIQQTFTTLAGVLTDPPGGFQCEYTDIGVVKVTLATVDGTTITHPGTGTYNLQRNWNTVGEVTGCWVAIWSGGFTQRFPWRLNIIADPNYP